MLVTVQLIVRMHHLRRMGVTRTTRLDHGAIACVDDVTGSYTRGVRSARPHSTACVCGPAGLGVAFVGWLQWLV